LEETDCSLAIKARERKVTGGLKEKKKEQTFVPLVSSQRNRGDERTEGATLKKPRERADTKKNWGKGTEEKPKKKTVKNNASRTQRKNPEKGGITEKPLVITEPGERRK
jgi:hypothetical protein